MPVLKRVSLLIAAAILTLALVIIVPFVYLFVQESQTVGVDQLWREKYNLESQTVAVRGVSVFDPHYDYGPRLWLVDDQASANERQSRYAFYFGIEIAELECDDNGTTMVCRPFDPGQADAFIFKGTLHLSPAGMFPVMDLIDIDFEQSRQLINGEWLPIPLGEFEIPID